MTKKNYRLLLFLLVFCNIFLVQNLLAKQKILFLGDSITAGYGIEKFQAYPALIENKLKEKGYKNLKIINGSISGSTTASGLSRLKWFSRAKPDIMILALGANDGLRGLNLNKMKLNLEKTIQFARKKKIKVILAGMWLPPNYGQNYSLKFKNTFYNLANKYKLIFIPFLLKNVGGISKLNQPDGIHPNVPGHQIIAETVLPYIIKAL